MKSYERVYCTPKTSKNSDNHRFVELTINKMIRQTSFGKELNIYCL